MEGPDLEQIIGNSYKCWAKLHLMKTRKGFVIQLIKISETTRRDIHYRFHALEILKQMLDNHYQQGSAFIPEQDLAELWNSIQSFQSWQLTEDLFQLASVYKQIFDILNQKYKGIRSPLKFFQIKKPNIATVMKEQLEKQKQILQTKLKEFCLQLNQACLIQQNGEIKLIKDSWTTLLVQITQKLKCQDNKQKQCQQRKRQETNGKRSKEKAREASALTRLFQKSND